MLLRPDVFAVVMATGITAISAADHHEHLISDTLAVLSGAALLSLVSVAVGGLAVGRGFAFRHLDEPDRALQMFTFVAACGVLAARCDPHRLLFWVLGASAALAWLALTPFAALVARDFRGCETALEAHGCWRSVATSSVGIVLADAVRETRHRWLVPMCLAFWGLAVVIYAMITSLIVRRAVADRSTVHRAEADSWILMGGLAIATLAGNHIRGQHPAGCVDDDFAVFFWIALAAWLAVAVMGVKRAIVAIAQSPGS